MLIECADNAWLQKKLPKHRFVVNLIEVACFMLEKLSPIVHVHVCSLTGIIFILVSGEKVCAER